MICYLHGHGENILTPHWKPGLPYLAFDPKTFYYEATLLTTKPQGHLNKINKVLK